MHTSDSSPFIMFHKLIDIQSSEEKGEIFNKISLVCTYSWNEHYENEFHRLGPNEKGGE